MASRSLNKVLLIGNLTRDPELRYTPQGTAVCSFGLATNRQWTTEEGEKKEDVEFHTIVAWNRLAEICAEYLKKGSQSYVEGRLSTREWEGQDGQKRRTTEVVANEVIFLGGRASQSADLEVPADLGEQAVAEEKSGEEKSDESKENETVEVEEKTDESSSAKATEDKPEEKKEEGDIPF
ncbi:MAG: single-stranded DNA-binding protein [Candidatus Blackburnbacteria bacterium]|nr:single-stranded DNA-binding protein [Candidatus Blackburnbacteria bacterium]